MSIYLPYDINLLIDEYNIDYKEVKKDINLQIRNLKDIFTRGMDEDIVTTLGEYIHNFHEDGGVFNFISKVESHGKIRTIILYNNKFMSINTLKRMEFVI